MKERFNVEIAGISFSVVTDDGEAMVRNAEAMLNENVAAVLKQMGRFSKLDAVTLCALDYCAQAQKAEAKIRNLEAQIEILEANMHRLRGEEDAPAVKASPEVKPAPEKKAAPAPETKVEAKAEVKSEAKSEAVPEVKTG